ncbi:MAG: hypothetical protein L0271_00320 [Gemmatimonadetes bacterium]|nr:hypothetical protein [Gemmatimonadota bacterium]
MSTVPIRSGLVVAIALLAPRTVAGQLRPLDPIAWEIFEPDQSWTADAGIGFIRDQPLSLAGTRGDLLELGNFRVMWRSGRVGVEIAGTVLRRFDDETAFADPVFGARPADGEMRQDAGDMRASTMVRLNGERPVQLALRFGTRLPTTSEEEGLDRDRTDFFATIGARCGAGALSVGGESGIAINGTRADGIDQLDVWTYSLSIDFRIGRFVSYGTIVGQNDLHRRVVRGNEDLTELRLGVRSGDRVRVAVTLVHGLADFSPGRGLLVSIGLRNRLRGPGRR